MKIQILGFILYLFCGDILSSLIFFQLHSVDTLLTAPGLTGEGADYLIYMVEADGKESVFLNELLRIFSGEKP